MEPKLYNPIMLKLFPSIQHPDFDKAMGHMVLCAKSHEMCRVIGHPGSGKTTMLMAFMDRNPNAVYICPPKGTRSSDLLSMLGKPIGYYPGRGTVTAAIEDIIDFLNSRGSDTVFLIDEADHLLPGARKYSIDRLDVIRHIWDFTKLKTSIIFAGPYDLEVRIQKCIDNMPNSQIYRRCKIHEMESIPTKALEAYLSQIEHDFHVTFDSSAHKNLIARAADSKRGGIGITAGIIENCLMAILPQWFEYRAFIEQDVQYGDAIELFKDEPIRHISAAMVENGMNMQR